MLKYIQLSLTIYSAESVFILILVILVNLVSLVRDGCKKVLGDSGDHVDSVDSGESCESKLCDPKLNRATLSILLSQACSVCHAPPYL